MRATIRQNSLANLHADVDAAMSRLRIDDSGTYRSVLVIRQPGEPTLTREEVLSGAEVRATLRVQLQVAMHEVEQDAPDVIEARWARESARNQYRTQTCTYTRTAASVNTPEPVADPRATLAPEPVPAHVTEPADYIALVADDGDSSDALDLCGRLTRDGHTKQAIDVRRAITRGVLDRAVLRKVAEGFACQLREEYREARTLLAVGPRAA
ncbi:hypothetical protein ACFT54_09985 [Streptomyces cinereoruber]|uniref:hypothetical protein n=1 Tax=Streptomyces cinereoruber TaxID=67260 RepID=UPI003635F349